MKITGLQLKRGQEIRIGEVISRLFDFGYERSEMVKAPGQFNLLGGTLVIFPVNTTWPVKIDLFGSDIESIYSFDLRNGKRIQMFSDMVAERNILRLNDSAKIKPGDYVVHEDYGIGIFRALGVREAAGKTRDYIFLEYLNGDSLCVPVELNDKLSPYIGVGRKKPKLSKLGSQTWQRTYKKTYENVILLARELLALYAVRSIKRRQAWHIDKHWDEEIISTFPYRDTIDQAAAVKDVYDDLERNIPMDRLISGDVGFGKTEVAIRTSAQAVANGFQVVMLVPTIILVEQHYITFKKRFADLPVVIEHLSRFIENSGQKQIIKNVESGQVDILIGTHRLLGDDVNYKNLGLYVVDEEQRFGVKQKEKIKKIREEVNILTLSATPIPRTLFMSLSGIRDISQINTPPADRLAIETKITKEDFNNVKKYVEREVNRGGQIYYLHNEVSTIIGKKNQLQKMFPGLAIDVAHGQMGEEKLARTMSRFTSGEIQLLVCSTIIENGLDLSNVNTLIVENAEKFGLAQLYQIRGRIGRSSRRAYALLMCGQKKITRNAVKRLRALAENAELGSGYTIALSDLEIRGGGNILGREQHGNMETVGLILYSKLLKKAVERLRGKALTSLL